MCYNGVQLSTYICCWSVVVCLNINEGKHLLSRVAEAHHEVKCDIWYYDSSNFVCQFVFLCGDFLWRAKWFRRLRISEELKLWLIDSQTKNSLSKNDNEAHGSTPLTSFNEELKMNRKELKMKLNELTLNFMKLKIKLNEQKLKLIKLNLNFKELKIKLRKLRIVRKKV